MTSEYMIQMAVRETKIITTWIPKESKTELYDPFRENLEIHSREYPIKFRKRVGRSNIKYVDRMPNFTTSSTKSACSLMDFVDFDSIEKNNIQEKVVTILTRLMFTIPNTTNLSDFTTSGSMILHKMNMGSSFQMNRQDLTRFQMILR